MADCIDTVYGVRGSSFRMPGGFSDSRAGAVAAQPEPDQRGPAELPLRLHGALLQRAARRRRIAALPAEQFGAAFGLPAEARSTRSSRLRRPRPQSLRQRTASRASGCPRAGTHRCTGARSGGDSGRPGPTTTTPYTDCETTSQPSGAAAADGGCSGRSACRSTARTCMGVCADAAAAAARPTRDRPRVRRRPAGGVQHGAARRRTRDRVPGAQRADAHAVLPADAGQRQGVGGALAR